MYQYYCLMKADITLYTTAGKKSRHYLIQIFSVVYD